MASSITALVIEKNDNVFINAGNPLSIGLIAQIPTPDGGAFIDSDYWAVPINLGTYSGFNFVPYNPNNPTESVAPTIDSYACFKLSKQPGNNGSSDWYMVLGTSSAYITAVGGGAALATVWPARSHTEALLPVCQTMDQVDANGLYFATVGVPSTDVDPTTIETYFIYGSINGVRLPAATANGYSTLASLLTFLNTATVNTGTTAAPVYTGGWAIVGTWTKTSDNLTLLATQSAGTGTDYFCADLITIIPSA